MSVSLVSFGLVIPAFMFVFAAFAAHVMMPLSPNRAFKRLSAHGRIVAELCIARSMALATAGNLVVVKRAFLYGDEMELVSCWFIVVMMHEMGTYLLLRLRPPYVSVAIFTMLCIMCVMSYYDAMSMLSLVALGDVMCSLEFSTYVTRTLGEPDLFPKIDIFHTVAKHVVNMTLLIMLVRAIWWHTDDLATKSLCAYVYFRYQATHCDIYFHVPEHHPVLEMTLDDFSSPAEPDYPPEPEDESPPEREQAIDNRPKPVQRLAEHEKAMDDRRKPTQGDTMVDTWIDGLKKV